MTPFAVLYYTCNTHDPSIEEACRRQLRRAMPFEITAVSLKPIAFGDQRLVLDRPRSPVTMHEQVYAGLKAMTAENVFLCESDVLYHASHFACLPIDPAIYYYNVNVWKVRSTDGHAIRTADCQQVSGCCANRALLLEHYRNRLERIAVEGFRQRNGYEPGTKLISKGGYDAVLNNQSWSSLAPNVDIRHDKTLTISKWSVDEFRNKKYAEGWQETDHVPGWPCTGGQFWPFINGVIHG